MIFQQSAENMVRVVFIKRIHYLRQFNLFFVFRLVSHLTLLQIYFLILKGGSLFMPPALAMANLKVVEGEKI
jgi:hypothetical protein